MLKLLYRYFNRDAVRDLYMAYLQEWHIAHPYSEDDAWAYDEWKNSYRNKFADYEAAHLRQDYDEAERLWKEFEVLFTPRLEHHGLTSLDQIQYMKYPVPQ